MGERTQANTIPMNSKLSLAEVDALIHNKETPAFSEKNSITYQGIVRNARISQGAGYITTHGQPLVKGQLYFSKWLEWKKDYNVAIKALRDAQNLLSAAQEEKAIADKKVEDLLANKPDQKIENPDWTVWNVLYQEWLGENPEPEDKESEEWQLWKESETAWRSLHEEPEDKEITNPKYEKWVSDLAAAQEDVNRLSEDIRTYSAEVEREQEKFDAWLVDNPEPEDKDAHTTGKIGTTLTDKNGKVYKVPHNWLLKTSYQLKNYTGGRVISAAVYDEDLFILYDDDDIWSLVVADNKTKELKNLYQLNNLENIDPVICATIGSVYNSNKAPTLWMLTKQEKQTDSKYIHEIVEVELKKGARTKTYSVTCYPLGHRMTATDVTGYGEGKTVAFEDIDQDRRAYFRLRNGEFTYHPYFGTVSPGGIVTGEPIPIVYDRDGDGNVTRRYEIENTRLNNGTIAWNVKKTVNSHGNTLSLLTSLDAEDKEIITDWKTIDSSYKFWVSANISINDKAAGGATGPLAEPKNYFISNFADSKGVYYDWGQGWSKTYYRISETSREKVNYMEINTVGAVPAVTSYSPNWKKRLVRVESLMSGTYGTAIDYKKDHLNERIYTVGGDNKGDNSILGAIPFSVELLYQGPNDPNVSKKIGLLRSQVFGLIETSYSFKQTLLTTPSEGADEENNMNLSWEDDNSLTLYTNGEIYEIIKSSDCSDFNFQKVADYSFKLNVLDNKNLIKEDRDGNISLVRAFIPYNMDAVLAVTGLNLKPAGVDIKDPNDAWFEGIGYNVNLDVDEPAMSFLLPKIRLPLWIHQEDWNTFKTEAIDKRNSILKPVLNGSFLEGESVDTYYTLQKDSQDCTYKTTQVMKFGTEAEKAGWDIYGKATYDILKKGMSWWMEEANTTIFPIGIGSTIAGINFIAPSAQLPQGYASRLYTANNRLFLGFNYLAQIWHGATIFTIYGSNYYYDGQGIYFVGSDQDFTNNNFVTYALGMKFLANSGSEAYFYSDFEKRLYVFTGSNTLQAADLLSNINGTIVDAAFSSKEQALYMLTDEGHIIVRTQVDLCSIPDMNANGHLEGTTEGCAIVGEYDYSIFSPHSGDKVIPFKLRTEHFGSTEFLQKLDYVDVVLYKDDLCPTVTVACQTLNGVERSSEELTVELKAGDWRGSTYRIRLSPKLNVGNAFDVGVYSDDKIGVQNITFYTEQLGTGQGDSWQDNITSYKAPASISDDEDVFE